MKKILRDIILYSLALYILTASTPAVKVSGNVEVYLIAGTVLALANNLIRPTLSAITLPFVILSLGLFSFVISAVILFVLTKAYPAVSVHGFNLDAVKLPGVELPPIYISTILSYLVVSVIIELVRRIVGWLFQE